jgi:hypothetical protein
MKNLLFLFLLLIIPWATKGQCSIDSATIVRFPKNVAIKINDMARHIPLKPDEQIQIGRLFQDEDSIRQAINIENDSIDEVVMNEILQTELQSVIGADKYSKLKMEEKAPFLQNDTNTECDERIAYLEEKLTKMQTHKSASTEVIDNITLSYDSLCMLQSGKPLFDLFMEALHKTSSDTAWFAALYEREIRENSYIAAFKDLNWYMLQMRLHPEKGDDVLQILWNRNKEANKIFFTYTESEMRSKLLADAVQPYEKKLHDLLVREGINTPQNLLFKLVYFKRQLLLDEIQVDALIEKGYTIADDSLFTSNDTLVFNTFRPFFEKTLNEEQFNEVLLITVLPRAREMTNDNFENIAEKQKIPKIGLNAFKEDLFKYFLAVSLTHERFKQDSVDLDQRLNILKQTQAPYYYKVYNEIPVVNKRNTGTYMW